MTNNFYVYIYFRLNGLPCYVGKGKGNRWRAHLGWTHNPHLRNIIKNAPREIPIVIVGSRLTECEAFELEKAIIAAIGREENGGFLVNLTDGGEGASGAKHSAESIERSRTGNLGKRRSLESRMRQSASNIGRHHTEETKAKIGAKHKGKIVSEETRQKSRLAQLGQKRPYHAEKHRGKKQSPETIEKRIAPLRGRKQTAEAIERRIDAVRKTMQSDEYRSKCSARVKAIWAARREVGYKSSRDPDGRFQPNS